jgi:hypothetical protein
MPKIYIFIFGGRGAFLRRGHLVLRGGKVSIFVIRDSGKSKKVVM